MMAYTEAELGRIYDSNSGYCWHCGKKLAWSNYGIIWARAAWEVDHGNPLSRGGVDDFRNLRPACLPCNRSKRDLTTGEFSRYL